MNKVSISDAENNLSELIASAGTGEPQIITKNGVETAILISYADYQKLTARKESPIEFLLNSPLRSSDIDLTRSTTGSGRDTLEFN